MINTRLNDKNWSQIKFIMFVLVYYSLFRLVLFLRNYTITVINKCFFYFHRWRWRLSFQNVGAIGGGWGNYRQRRRSDCPAAKGYGSSGENVKIAWFLSRFALYYLVFDMLISVKTYYKMLDFFRNFGKGMFDYRICGSYNGSDGFHHGQN